MAVAANKPAPEEKAASAKTSAVEDLPKYRIPNPKQAGELVRVRSAKTGNILPNRVPRTWLDGRFPQLKEVPSNKKGK